MSSNAPTRQEEVTSRTRPPAPSSSEKRRVRESARTRRFRCL